jgi:hypothetical protein
MPYDLCSMLYAPCPMLSALCPLPSALCPMLSAILLVVAFQLSLRPDPSKIVGCESLDSTIDVGDDVVIL